MRRVSPVISIFKREFKSFFYNMTGPVFVAAVMVFMGIYFNAYNMAQGYPYFAVVLSGVSIILLLVVPVLTMRSFAEEKHSKTDQMLLTSPLSVVQIVLGKYFSMVAVFAINMLVACLGPVVMMFYGGGAIPADYAAIFAFLLLGSAYIAIGMFVSSLTESQVIAAVGTFCILLVLQLARGIASIIPDSSITSYICFFVLIVIAAALLFFMVKNVFVACGVGAVALIALTVYFFVDKNAFSGAFPDMISNLSLVNRFDTIVSQTFDISVIVYYLTVAALFVFFTVQSVQKRRWS